MDQLALRREKIVVTGKDSQLAGPMEMLSRWVWGSYQGGDIRAGRIVAEIGRERAAGKRSGARKMGNGETELTRMPIGMDGPRFTVSLESTSAGSWPRYWSDHQAGKLPEYLPLLNDRTGYRLNSRGGRQAYGRHGPDRHLGQTP